VWVIVDWLDALDLAVESPRPLLTDEDERAFRQQVVEQIWADWYPPPDAWQHVTIRHDHSKILQDPVLGPRFMRARDEAQRRRQEQRERWTSMSRQERYRWMTMMDDEREIERERLRTAIDEQLRTFEHRPHSSPV
jgi:hypothetical protein